MGLGMGRYWRRRPNVLMVTSSVPLPIEICTTSWLQDFVPGQACHAVDAVQEVETPVTSDFIQTKRTDSDSPRVQSLPSGTKRLTRLWLLVAAALQSVPQAARELGSQSRDLRIQHTPAHCPGYQKVVSIQPVRPAGFQ